MTSKWQIKYSGRTFAVCVEKGIKRLSSSNFQNDVTLKDQDATLSRWREYSSDLVNAVDATPTQIDKEQVGEDIQITEADVKAVTKSL